MGDENKEKKPDHKSLNFIFNGINYNREQAAPEKNRKKKNKRKIIRFVVSATTS